MYLLPQSPRDAGQVQAADDMVACVARALLGVPPARDGTAQHAGVFAPAAGRLFDDEDVPRCFVCGCTDERACQGGCTWAAGPADRELCSRCAEGIGLAVAALERAASLLQELAAACQACRGESSCSRHHDALRRAALYREAAASHREYLPAGHD